MRTGAKRVLGLALAIALLGGTSVASARDGSVRFVANLTGTQELQDADPDGSGTAKVDINVAAGEVCFQIKVDNTGTPNRGHIHTGDSTTNGGIVVPFFELREDPSDPRHDGLESDRKIEGCVSADPALLTDIVAHPDLYYVNLHNARFPAGSMRCQLES